MPPTSSRWFLRPLASTPLNSAPTAESGSLFPEQVERWPQASQDANEKPVLTLKSRKSLTNSAPKRIAHVESNILARHDRSALLRMISQIDCRSQEA